MTSMNKHPPPQILTLSLGSLLQTTVIRCQFQWLTYILKEKQYSPLTKTYFGYLTFTEGAENFTESFCLELQKYFSLPFKWRSKWICFWCSQQTQSGVTQLRRGDVHLSEAASLYLPSDGHAEVSAAPCQKIGPLSSCKFYVCFKKK